MIPTILKPGSLSIHCKKGVYGTALTSIKGRKDFFSTIRSLMSRAKKGSFHRPTEPPHAGLPPKKGYHFYLESLRRGLLAKGKPLDQTSLNNKDIPVLKKLLYQCGFSQEAAENLLKELLHNNPGREINLSQFFNKIAEVFPTENDIFRHVTAEPSAIPHLESALRDLGLAPKEVEHAISASRVKGGGLDLNKFVLKIKGIGHQGMPLQDKLKLDQFVKATEAINRSGASSGPITAEPSAIPHLESALRDLGLAPKEVEHVLASVRVEGLSPENHVRPVHDLAHQISKNLGRMGARIPNEGNGGEQMIGRGAQQSQLSTDVKTTIDQILERVVIANEKNGPQSPLFSFSKPGLTDLHSKGKIGKKGRRVENESLLSPSREKGSISAKDGQQRSESPFPSKQAKLFSDLDAGKAHPLRLSSANRDNGGEGLKGGAKEGGYSATSKTRTIDIPQNISSSTFSESINTVKQDLEPVRDFLPSYLINQVGTQISRSILRGEKAIRLQLKPTELGALKVEMDMKDNILKIGIITENSSVKELLLSSAHELRESLVEQGIRLERLDIQIDYDSNQSMAYSHEGQRREQGLDEKQITNGNGDREDLLAKPMVMSGGTYLINVIA